MKTIETLIFLVRVWISMNSLEIFLFFLSTSSYFSHTPVLNIQFSTISLSVTFYLDPF